MKKIFYYTLFFILTACNSVIHEENIIYVDIDNAKSINFSEWFSKVEIIPLETNRSSVINECYKTVFANQRFYIYDQRQSAVFVFDSVGKFLFNTLSLKGRGPGEYLSMSDFSINRFTGNIEILDAFSFAIRVYDKDGSFIKSIRLTQDLLPLGTFQQLSSDLYLFNSPDYEKTKTTIKVYSIRKNEIVKKILPLPKNTRHLPVTNRTDFSYLFNGDVLFSYKFPNNDIFLIDTMSAVVAQYKYNFGRHTFNLKKLPTNRDKTFYTLNPQSKILVYFRKVLMLFFLQKLILEEKF